MKPRLILCLALILSGVLSGCSTTASNVGSKALNHPSGLPVLYHNTQYDFTFFLPASWLGYSVLARQWMDEAITERLMSSQGYSEFAQQWDGETYLPAADRTAIMEHGPMIVLRHPQWKPDDR